MLKVGETIHLTASDLVGHLDCHDKTRLDLAVANGALAKPKIWDPVLELLAERGALYEQGYIEHSITSIEEFSIDRGAVEKTLAAMKARAQIIVQGTLQSGHWNGRADILRRVDGKPSALGFMNSSIPNLHARRRAAPYFRYALGPFWPPQRKAGPNLPTL